jgi:signal transduction histidine kinase
LIQIKGARAFETLHDPTSEFFFRDTYVFVIDEKGYVYVNSPFGNLEGKNLLGLTDQAGKPFISEMIKVAKKDGSGWVEYLWAKPGETKYSRKRSYVEKVQLDGKTLIVGCGVYLN